MVGPHELPGLCKSGEETALSVLLTAVIPYSSSCQHVAGSCQWAAPTYAYQGMLGCPKHQGDSGAVSFHLQGCLRAIMLSYFCRVQDCTEVASILLLPVPEAALG